MASLRAARGWTWTTASLTVGAFVLAVALAPPASAAPGRGLAWALFVGSSVHVASTGWLYTFPDLRGYAARRPLRLLWIPAALVLASAVTAAALSPQVLTWLLLPFFAWQFVHFQKQNLGMAALAASSGRLAPLRSAERRALIAAGWAGVGGLVAHPALLQLPVTSPLAALFPVSALAFGLAAVAGLALLWRRPPGDRPAGFCVIYLMALLFFLPVFVFASPYAAVGGMTIAHGLQYLLLVGLVAAGGQQGAARAVRLVAFCILALAGGTVLDVTSHLHGAAPAGRLLFGAYLGAVMAHFVVDAAAWRLRDPFPRAFLARRVPCLVPAAAARGGLRQPPPAPVTVASAPGTDGSAADIR